jgi:hypothetical protein
LHDPLRSEADAFRWLIAIGVGLASVILLALLTTAVIAVIWAAALLVFGAALALRSSRGIPLPEPQPHRGGGDGRRLLVVANHPVASPSLMAEIEKRCRNGEDEVLIVVPAITGSRAARWASDLDAPIEAARERMEASLEALRRAGLRARGQVADSDPNLALGDALRVFAAHEVIISTNPPDRAQPFEHGMVQRAHEESDVPVIQVVVDVED